MDEPVSELGLSLTELSETYAALLGEGNDPYRPVPEPTDVLGRSVGELAAEPAVSLPAYHGQAPDDLEPIAILEAMLFVGHPEDRAMSSAQIASLMRGVSANDVEEWIGQLNEQYDRNQAPYRVESTVAGFRMALRSEYSSFADVFLGRVREARLAQSAIDVLAIVAYGQPVSRQEVDRLRGQPSGAVLAQLVRRDLLRVERSEIDRQILLYRTTERFLDLFGLCSLDDLPRSQDLERS
ncbi:MAG: SMC-Scp complex subunit ScpB [Planctomycetes bacterium]|nr:SMC-Scp complex subunit ScpB [Planctomycetota bacterium]